MPWFSERGQALLSRSLVLVVGCGGVGCSCSSVLARSGIGGLRIVDRDVIGITDIHRQILFEEADAAELNLKAIVAAERLRRANENVDIEPVLADLNPENADALVRDVDLVVDCSDNFRTRVLLNEVCLRHSKPWIHTACVGTTAMVIPFPAGGRVCYRCIVDHIPTTETACEEAGIFAPVAIAAGSIEAGEAVKLIVSPSHPEQRIIFFDALSNTWETIGTRHKRGCPACERGFSPYLDGTEPWDDRRVCSKGVFDVRLGRPLDLGVIRQLPDEILVHDIGYGAMRIATEGRSAIVFADGAAILKGFNDVQTAGDFLKQLIGC
jgi:adenylyltransferase/sulfurtransferase